MRQPTNQSLGKLTLINTLPHDSYGVRDIVEKWCWNLLYNVERLRKDHLEVEVFARFLEVTTELTLSPPRTHT